MLPNRLMNNPIDVLTLETRTDSQGNADLDSWIGKQVALGTRRATIRLWRSGVAKGLSVSRRDVAHSAGQRALWTMQKRGLNMVVHQTGGTAVPQGEGVLHLSWLLPRSRETVTTDAYFRLLCEPILGWLSALGASEARTGALPESYCDGKYNILVSSRKLAGTAQSWKGGLAGIKGVHPGYVLAHACITVDVDFVEASDWINEFYRLSENPYRVNPETAVNLRDLLMKQATGRFPVHSTTNPNDRDVDRLDMARFTKAIIGAANTEESTRIALASLRHYLLNTFRTTPLS